MKNRYIANASYPIKDKVDRRYEVPSIVVEQVIPIEQASQQLTQTVKFLLREAPGRKNGATAEGELTKLRLLLRQAVGGANGGAASGALAQVMIEVDQNGLVAQMRVNSLRIAVDADLAQRIATVLQSPGCCQLLGPAKPVGFT